MCTVCRMKYPGFTQKSTTVCSIPLRIFLHFWDCFTNQIASKIDETLTDIQLVNCIFCRNLSQLSELNHKPLRWTLPLTGQQLQLLDSSVNFGRHVVNAFEKRFRLCHVCAMLCRRYEAGKRTRKRSETIRAKRACCIHCTAWPVSQFCNSESPKMSPNDKRGLQTPAEIGWRSHLYNVYQLQI